MLNLELEQMARDMIDSGICSREMAEKILAQWVKEHIIGYAK